MEIPVYILGECTPWDQFSDSFFGIAGDCDGYANADSI